MNCDISIISSEDGGKWKYVNEYLTIDQSLQVIFKYRWN